MEASRVILNNTFAINNRYRVVLYVIRVEASKKIPSGIKAKFVLIDSKNGTPRLLIDNHEPFGFHMHTKLPAEENVREPLPVKDHNEALTFFFQEVERIIQHEQSEDTNN